MQQNQEFGWCRLILYIISALVAFWIANAISPVTDGILDAVIAALIFIGLLLLFWWLSRKICGMLGGNRGGHGVADQGLGGHSGHSGTGTSGAAATGAAAAGVAGGAAAASTSSSSAHADGDAAVDAGVDVSADVNVDAPSADVNVDTTTADIDGDGVADTLDVDGDGVADVDLSADGKVDVDANASAGAAVDLDGDGKADGVAVDVDGDGKVDGVDLDGDGKADVKARAASGERISDTKHASEMSEDERAAAREQAGLLTEAREGGPDDLKKIKGVGPKFEGLMHEIGVFHFDQIANWTTSDIQFVDDHLTAFKGRIVRDDWVGQAKLLADGGETAFSKKVDKGGVYKK